MAERSTFSTMGAMRLLADRRMVIAAPAFWPRIISTTSRAFCGDVRTYLASALASILAPKSALLLRWLCCLFGRRSTAGGGRGRGLHRMSPELARWRKFTQLAAHHVLGNVYRNELLAVVDRQRVADEFGPDGGPPRPGAHHLLFVALIHRGHFVHQVIIGKRAFF